MYPTLEGEAEPVRGSGAASATRQGARLGCTVSRSEVVISPVIVDKPKALTGLGQKGEWTDLLLMLQ